MAIEVIPNTESNPEDLKFTWRVEETGIRTIKFQLLFENPKAVSSSSHPDILRLTFWDPFMYIANNDMPLADTKRYASRRLAGETGDIFGSEEGRALAKADTMADIIYIEQSLPAQLPLSGPEYDFMQALTSAMSTTKVVVAATFGFSFLFGLAMNKLWSMISTQQLFVMMPLFQIQMPANAGVVFNLIMQIAAFDYIDLSENIYELGVKPTQPIDANFEMVGLESQYLIVNMGTMLALYMLYGAVAILTLLLLPVTR